MGVDARPRKSNVSNLVKKTAFKSSLCHHLIANSPVIEPTVEESFRLSPKNLTMLSCRAGHSRFRHFLGNFGECRFGRLFLGFLFIHSFHDLCFGVFVPLEPLTHGELSGNMGAIRTRPEP